jgi:two-component system, cell cycle response regulator
VIELDAEEPRVLIVEDDPVSAKLIHRLFVTQGIAVHQAHDGLEALRLHSQHPYRIVVSDWMMPEMDGVSLCREFRKLGGPYVYFILCTARHQREDRLEAYDAGVDDFLVKPLDRHELHARLNVARRILASEDALQRQNEQLEVAALELARANTDLGVASRRYQELFDGLPVACFTFDQDGLIQKWNRAAVSVFGIDSVFAEGRPLWELLGTADRKVWSPQRVKSLFETETQPTFDWQYSRQGELRYLACSIIALTDLDKNIGAICSNIDITKRKRAEHQVAEQTELLNRQKIELEAMNQRLSHLAITDGLTGLWNHRRFKELLSESVELFGRTLEPFSLILLDIDHFKGVNDELGHQVGDEVLQQFAETIRQCARSYELPARYGGEEFAIILRNCNDDQAVAAAERFRAAVQKHHWKHRPMTASFGVATYSVPGINPNALIMEADHALYAAKQRGRNRVVHWRELKIPSF